MPSTVTRSRSAAAGPKLPPSLAGLFCRAKDRAPMSFAMAFGSKRKEMRTLIEQGGGVMSDPAERDVWGDRVHLADPEATRPADLRRAAGDVFSCQYIRDCVDRNHLLDNLAEYRINPRSRFEDYDPCDVLLGYLKWADVTRSAARGRGEDSSGEEVSDFEEDSDNANARNGGKTDKPAGGELRRTRRPYTRDEQAAMLRYIARNGLYNDLKGNELWKLVEKTRVCPGRTWQSLKENFRKQVIPQIYSFNLTPAKASYFKRAWSGDQVLVLAERDPDDDEEAEEVPEEPEEPEQPSATGREKSQQRAAEKGATRKSPRKKSPKKSNPEPPVEFQALSPGARIEPEDPPAASSPQPAARDKTPPKQPAAVRKLFNLQKEDGPMLISPSVSVRTERLKRRRNNSGGSRDAQAPAIVEDDSAVSPAVSSPAAVSPPGAAARSASVSSPSPTKGAKHKKTPSPDENREPNAADVFKAPEAGPSKFSGGRKREKKQILKVATGIRRIRRDSPDLTDSSDDEDDEDDRRSVVSTASSSVAGRYSAGEDEAIARYVRDRGLIRHVKGRLMWEEAAAVGDLPEGRSWQSVKERFLKRILPSRGREYFIPVAGKKKKGSAAAGKSPGEIAEAARSALQPSLYTDAEDQEIIDYIVANRRYDEVRGRAMWENAARRGVASGRSWQSMKERFLKRIQPNLGKYNCSHSERVKLKNC